MEINEKYCYWAATAKGVGLRRFSALMDSGLDLEECFCDPTIFKTAGFPDSVISELKKTADLDRIDEDVFNIEKTGARIVTFISDDYPTLLREISQPPALLYVKGSMDVIGERTIAVVGTRNCSLNGARNIEQISYDLAKNGVTIVSGMARGIDSAAHKGALDAGGKTVAVLGSGIDVIYPPENAKLYEKICGTGVVISEYPPGTAPTRGTFPARNRIISGVSRGVLFGEGLLSSGGHITVRNALDENRDVFAMPGDKIGRAHV